jgi:hypothetical protein
MSIKNASVSLLNYKIAGLLIPNVVIYGLHSESMPMYGAPIKALRDEISFSWPTKLTFTFFGNESKSALFVIGLNESAGCGSCF